MRNTYLVSGLILIALILSFVLVFTFKYKDLQNNSVGLSSQTDLTISAEKRLYINGEVVSLEVAKTQEDQVRGLSGRESLAEDRGMLFVFPYSDFWAFWMKDMKFSIDMIWLDASSTVVTLKSNVSPDTYPEVFVPTKPAVFVLETKAGFAERHRIRVSDKLDIR